jgi:hypothetical protein
MSYRALGGEFDFSIDWKSTGYLGLNLASDAITKAILDTGSADESALASYGAMAGAAGGAAVCAATGAGAIAAPACAAVGGAIGKILAGQIGKAAGGGSVAWKFVDTWNISIVPTAKEAQRGALAVRVYLTNRDELLDEAADIIGGNRAVAHMWANQWLASRGAPPAPVHAMWSPDVWPARWDAFKRISEWAFLENLGGYEFPYTGKLQAALFSDKPTEGYWTKYHNEICSLKSKTGLSCAQLALLKYYPAGVPSPPGAPIDWSLVGAFQVARTLDARPAASASGRSGSYGCAPDRCTVPLNIPNKGQLGSYPPGSVLTGMVISPYNPQKSTEATAQPFAYADVIPTSVGNKLNVLLAELRLQLIIDAGKKAGKAPKVVTPPDVDRFGWQAAAGAGILVAGAIGAWVIARR